MSVNLLNVSAGASSVAGDALHGLEVVAFPDKALALVQTLSPNRPINLITIWGPARTGKSFFMNALAGQGDADIFQVKGGVDPCTVGAYISTTAISWAEFAQQEQCDRVESEESCSAPLVPPVSQPMIGFVDVEGQGDKHFSYDMLLATPLLLVSKVVFFNWKGAPNKSSMLDSLAVMTHAAAVIGEDQRQNVFGHLIVLLRDVSPIHEESAQRLLFVEEDAGSATTLNEEQQVTARNEKRKMLHMAFASVRVVCLPRPHPDIDDTEISVDQVSLVFGQTMAGLRRVLADEMVLDAHHIGGQSVFGGAVLASLLTEVVNAVNQASPNLQPLSMMDLVHQRLAGEAFSDGIESFKSFTASLDGPIDISKASMTSFLQRATSATMESFDETTTGLAKSVVESTRGRLADSISGRVESLLARQQVQLAEALVNIDRLVHGARRLVDEQAPEAFAIMPMLKGGNLFSGWDMMWQIIHSRLEGDIEDQVVAGLREDLRTAIPSLEEFMQSVKDVETRQKALDAARKEAEAFKEEAVAARSIHHQTTGHSTSLPKLQDRIFGLPAVILDVFTLGTWRTW